MKTFLTLATAAVAAATFAAPASAVITTFAQFGTIGTGQRTFWKNSTGVSSGTGGSIYTTNTSSSTTPGSRPVQFSFLQAGLAPYVTNVTATFTLLATAPAGNPAQLNSGFLVQPGLNGSFSFLSTSAITIGSTTYAAGSNLLSGVFTAGTIFGPRNGSSGSFSGSTTSGSTITYTSDFLSFAPTVDRDFSITLTSISPVLAAVTGRSLRNFRATSTGSFSTDPAPVVLGAIPEPATWGMLLVGFGMVGVAARRRKTTVAA